MKTMAYAVEAADALNYQQQLLYMGNGKAPVPLNKHQISCKNFMILIVLPYRTANDFLNLV